MMMQHAMHKATLYNIIRFIETGITALAWLDQDPILKMGDLQHVTLPPHKPIRFYHKLVQQHMAVKGFRRSSFRPPPPRDPGGGGGTAAVGRSGDTGSAAGSADAEQPHDGEAGGWGCPALEEGSLVQLRPKRKPPTQVCPLCDSPHVPRSPRS